MQANLTNRNYQPKRGPGPMVANPQYQPQVTPQQLQAQQQAEAQKRDRARRQSKKPTDLDIPEGIEDIVIGDAVHTYRRGREIERKLDATMMRKKLDMQDQTQRQEKRPRTMRILIWNTAENQPWQNTSMDPDAFDFGDSSQATYKVHIDGRLLDEEDSLDEPDAGEDAKSHAPGIHVRSRLSHFFKQITVDFDRPPSLQPDGMAAVEWKRPPPDPRSGAPSADDAANFDCLRFERKSDENINVRIKLHRDENPERFQLSPELAEICDTMEDDRPGVMYKLWSYIRHNKLQESEDIRIIRCDGPLKKAFHHDVIQFTYIPDLILGHLKPLPPLVLPYTIRVDSAYINATPKPSPYTIYDVTVMEDDPLRTRIVDTLWHSNNNVEIMKQISNIDDQLALVIQAIHQGKAKHNFLTAMAKDPVGFMKRWTSSQRRDMEIILGESSRGMGSSDEGGLGEEWRKGGADGVWGGDVAKESVGLFLARGGRHASLKRSGSISSGPVAMAARIDSAIGPTVEMFMKMSEPLPKIIITPPKDKTPDTIRTLGAPPTFDVDYLDLCRATLPKLGMPNKRPSPSPASFNVDYLDLSKAASPAFNVDYLDLSTAADPKDKKTRQSPPPP